MFIEFLQTINFEIINGFFKIIKIIYNLYFKCDKWIKKTGISSIKKN